MSKLDGFIVEAMSAGFDLMVYRVGDDVRVKLADRVLTMNYGEAGQLGEFLVNLTQRIAEEKRGPH